MMHIDAYDGKACVLQCACFPKLMEFPMILIKRFFDQSIGGNLSYLQNKVLEYLKTPCFGTNMDGLEIAISMQIVGMLLLPQEISCGRCCSGVSH